MPLAAQQKRLSPHETISNRIDANRITIVYGRPYSKDPKSGEIARLGIAGALWQGSGARADESHMFIYAEADHARRGAPSRPAPTLCSCCPRPTDPAKLIVKPGRSVNGARSTTRNRFCSGRIEETGGGSPGEAVYDGRRERLRMAAAMLRLIWEETQYTVTFTVEK